MRRLAYGDNSVASFYSMEVSVSKSDFTTYLCRGSVLSELGCQAMCLLPTT